MITAHEIKKGMFVRHENKICKVIEHDYHMGGGRAGGLVHMKMRDAKTGHVLDVKIDPHEKIENIEVRRQKMKYLYEDASGLCFMDPVSFEQVSLSKEAVGHLAPYLKEDMEVEVEFFEDNPIHVTPPEKITLAVVTTGAATKGSTDNVYKTATVEGGVDILVPHFIKEGDRIIVDVESGKYLDRAK